MAVRVVTDSAACMGDHDLERLGLSIVPLHVLAEGQIVPEPRLRDPAFYTGLANGELPTTSQPAPNEFVLAFRELLDQGHDVLAVLISAGMSGTVRAAELAAEAIELESPGARVGILDTRSNSLEEGFAVLAAADAASAGASLEECRLAAEETMRRTRFLFAPHSLEYLRRGGRISGASALAGVMLKIAPVLTAQQGVAAVAGVARGARGARDKIASLMRADVERFGLRRAAVQYIVDSEEAGRFASEVIAPIAGNDVPVVPIHPVVGVHVGPAVGVVYETEEPMRGASGDAA